MSIGIAGSIIIIELPFSMDSAIVGIGFYVIGYCVKKYIPILLELKVEHACIVLMICTVLAVFNSTVNMRTNIYGIVPLFWINSIGLVVGFWNIFYYISKITKEMKVFVEIGAESIIYVCMNQFIIYWLAKIKFDSVLIENIWKIVMLAIVLSVCFITNRIIRSSFLAVILGERKKCGNGRKK